MGLIFHAHTPLCNLVLHNFASVYTSGMPTPGFSGKDLCYLLTWDLHCDGCMKCHQHSTINKSNA